MVKGKTSFLVFVSCLLVLHPGEVSGGGRQHAEGELAKQSLQRWCGFTRYPDLCMETLFGLGLVQQHEAIVSALMEKIRDETVMHISGLPNHAILKDELDSQGNPVTVGYCYELMDMSLRRLNQSLVALNRSPRKSKSDMQTWLSAVMAFQDACKDAVKDQSGALFTEISHKMDNLSKLASNALALVNRITSRPENTSDEPFPMWVSGKNRKLLQTTGIRANAIVAQDGTGNYKSISEAIKSASGGRFVIYVKSGVYREKLHINKDGITLIGDGKYSTVITGDDNGADGTSMPATATVAVTGDDFIAKDIGIQNTAGPGGGQALALRISSDRSVLYRCSIAGYQDTLYALGLRQFYRECDIHGTIDFIFGNAAAVFQSCNIILRRPQSGSYNVILANGRSDPGQSTGFSVHKSMIIAGSDLSSGHSVESYLGRPWKEYSRSVVMKSKIDSAIVSRGWIEWDDNFALKTLYFAEYLNEGPGAGTSGRVKWPGYHVIGPKEALQFTVDSFIKGSSWLPSTGIAFEAGLT
ncbi:probable pectinesterase/pectinesterase inhibitor 54 [Aristolochia californica]|uniref:probable pectinesterase/pectinesterase inhibitor 54 n=1 Tax=Aristolochia californica TaxID=171875 RepID=UPI0035D7923B